MATYGKRMMMTLVGGLGLLFVIACGTPSTVAAQGPGTPEFRLLIGAPVAGDNIVTGAYCVGVNEAFMKKFTAMLAQYGKPGYWDFIKQPGAPCYDTRMKRMKVNPVKATLVKRLWEFELFHGKTYVMWEVKDTQGGYAYTWTQIEGQET